jgi:hypothetical protein
MGIDPRLASRSSSLRPTSRYGYGSCSHSKAVGDVKQRNLIEAATPTIYFYTREPGGRGNVRDSDFAAALHARTARRRRNSRD